MKFLVLAITFMLSTTLFANEIIYTDASFKDAPLEHAHKLNEFFKDEGFVVLADPQHGVPSLGINQVYFKDEGVFVMVKYGIQGDFPLNEVVQTPDGAFLVHDQIGDNKFFLYFRGINEHSVRLTLSTMKDKLVTYKMPSLKSLIIPEAHASADCGSPAVVEQMTDFNNLSGKMVWDFAKNCVTGLGQGAWSSTGGKVTSTLSNVWNAVRHPIQTVDSIGRSVYNFTVGLARFIKGMVTDPRGTMSRIGQSAGNAWNGLVDLATTMTTAMKIQFICSFIGSLGVDAAIALFTGGGGAARLAAKLAGIANKFNLIANTLKVISKMNATARAAHGFTSQKMKNLMNKLMRGVIPDVDLSHLNKIQDKSFSIKALACYI